MRWVLRDASTTFDTTPGNVAILGRTGGGKSTLIEMLAGSLAPTQGRLWRRARVSWPLGWRGFSSKFTGEEGLGFLAKVYGVDRRAMLSYAVEVSGLAARVFEPMGKLKAEEKSRLMLAAAYALDFDVYLLDGSMPKVGTEFEPRFRALWLEKLQQKRVIMAASHAGGLEKNFAQAFIIDRASLSAAMPMSQAAAEFARLAQN